MFVDCREAENLNVKVAARELMAETNQLHSNYTKINVVIIFFCLFDWFLE